MYMVKSVCDATFVISCFCNMFHCMSQNHHIFAYKRNCLVLLNVVPPGFVFTFLISFSKHRLSISVDSASPYLSPTTVSKLSDIFPWIYTLLLVFSSVVLTTITYLFHNFYQLISINTIICLFITCSI